MNLATLFQMVVSRIMFNWKFWCQKEFLLHYANIFFSSLRLPSSFLSANVVVQTIHSLVISYNCLITSISISVSLSIFPLVRLHIFLSQTTSTFFPLYLPSSSSSSLTLSVSLYDTFVEWTFVVIINQHEYNCPCISFPIPNLKKGHNTPRSWYIIILSFIRLINTSLQPHLNTSLKKKNNNRLTPRIVIHR